MAKARKGGVMARARAARFCEPWTSIPWQCGDNDCGAAGGWHLGTYWIDGRGWTYDAYTSGDHEKVYKRDIPTAAQEDEAWREYATWCARTGRDPLANYMIGRPRIVKRWWSFHVAASANGPRLICWRKGRKGAWSFDRDELAKNVRSFLNLNEHSAILTLRDFDSMRDLVGSLRESATGKRYSEDYGAIRATPINREGAIGRVIFECRIEEQEVWSVEKRKKLVRQAARKHLRDMAKNLRRRELART